MGNAPGREGNESLPLNEEDLPYIRILSEKKFLDWRNTPSAETGASITVEEERQQKLEQQCMPVHISGNVFLADHRGAQKIGRLKHLGIAYVINVGGPALQPSNLEAFCEQNIDYKEIESGKESAILSKHLAEVRGHIAKAREAERNVVVYCKTGYDLSALFVAAEKMLIEGRTVLSTVAECRRLRGNDFLQNAVLQGQLVGLARRTGLLGARRGDRGCFQNIPGFEQSEALGFDPAISRSAFRGERLSRPGSWGSMSGSSYKSLAGSDLASSFNASVKHIFNSMGSMSQSFKVTQPQQINPIKEEDKVFLSILRDPLCLNWRNLPDPVTNKLLTMDMQDRVSKDQKNLPVQICEGVYLSNARAINRVWDA